MRSYDVRIVVTGVQMEEFFDWWRATVDGAQVVGEHFAEIHATGRGKLRASSVQGAIAWIEKRLDDALWAHQLREIAICAPARRDY